MILLKRTQELSENDWEALKDLACEKFGKEEYLDLLGRHEESLPRTQLQETPMFMRKNLVLAALKKEENGGRGD
jgi:hypothetical protein